MRYAVKSFAALATLAALSSCGSMNRRSDGEQPGSVSSSGPAQIGVSDDIVKIGAPYTVGGVSYSPQDTAQYDEVGYASYYGTELSGRPTANGEMFNPAGVTAAHKTLPMPSYVEVTALDTGRTILVRINDRGPFANDRLIDLSQGAAQQLGIARQGVAAVRVRRVNPPEQERTVLRQGITAAERIETPGPLLKVLRDKIAKQPRPALALQKSAPLAGKPVLSDSPQASNDGRFIREGAALPKQRPTAVRPAPAAGGDYIAQIAAFSSRARAIALARKIGGSVKASADGKLFRVHLGPYATEGEATASARQKGYSQARIYRD